MAQHANSRANLKQFRKPSTETEILPAILPSLSANTQETGAMTNQGLARNLAVAHAPGMVKVLINAAYGKGRGISHAVRIQAASRVLEVADVANITSKRSPDGLSGMNSDDLATFVQAGQRAMQLRQDLAGAEDAHVVSESGPVTT